MKILSYTLLMLFFTNYAVGQKQCLLKKILNDLSGLDYAVSSIHNRKLIVKLKDSITLVDCFPQLEGFKRQVRYIKKKHKKTFFIKITIRNKNNFRQKYRNAELAWEAKLRKQNPKAIIAKRVHVDLGKYFLILEDSFHGVRSVDDLFFIEKSEDFNKIKTLVACIYTSLGQNQQLYNWKNSRYALSIIADAEEILK